MVPVHDYVKRYAEAFAIMKIRTFKHEPFFIVGGGGGGAYSWYFTVHGEARGIPYAKMA